jgi:hypothetical protein
MYQAGYWWSSSWLKNIDGTDYNMIVQPDQYFVRLSFSGPGVTYYVDDMALTKSWIAGAEYNKNIMRVDFGYDTNLKELADATPLKAIPFPAENIAITGEEEGEEFELVIASAEYHNDGYLYIWIDQDDDFEYYENVKVSFKNPETDDLQLTYDGSLYPMALDTIWAKTKILPDFSGEPAFFNPSISAISIDQFPPTYVSSVPEDGSFNLEGTMNSFDVTFNKKVNVKVNNYDPSDTTSVIVVMRAAGTQEIWVPTAYNEETYTVTFSRQAGNTSTLAGDYEFDIVQARATARGPQAEKKTITLSFGEAGVAPHYYLNDPMSAKNEDGTQLNINSSVPYGFVKSDDAGILTGDGSVTVSGSRLMQFGEGGEFVYGMYLCQRGASTEGTLTYGEVEGYELTLPVGQVQVTFNAGGWDGKTPDFKFVMYSANDPETLLVDETIKVTKAFKAGEVVTGSTSCRFVVNIEEEGNYILKWINTTGWDGNTVGNIKVSNIFSAAYQYVQAYNEALASANGTITIAEANAIYSGEYLNTFKATIATKEGFKSTSPTAYNNIVAEIKAATADMSARMTNVDNYYKAYNTAIGLDTLYSDSIGYQDLAALATVKSILADYAELDVTVKNNDELNAITEEVNATTKTLTDRCAAIDAFDGNIADAENAFIDNAPYSNLAEFKALEQAYNANKDLAKFAVSDEELKAANDAISTAIAKLNGKVSAATVVTAQVKALAEMADALVTDWGTVDTEALSAQLEAELEDNQALANVYQKAIKAALEGMMADEGIDEAGMDMTYFIQNPGIYTYATSYQMNTNEDPIPGWNVTANNGAGFGMAWSNVLASADKPVVDSYVGLGWGANITMEQTLNNLPVGTYTITGVPEQHDGTNISGNIYVTQTDANGDMIAADTLTWKYGEADYALTFDVVDGSAAVTVVGYIASGNWSRFDNWSLMLNAPIKGYDYAAAAEASISALGEAFTGVGSVVAPSKVQFYNLNGMQVSEPNKGVNIRISTGKNGARIIEKVLIK